MRRDFSGFNTYLSWSGDGAAYGGDRLGATAGKVDVEGVRVGLRMILARQKQGL